MASDPIVHVTKALDIPVGTPIEDRLDALRDMMMNGFAPIVDACLANLVLPAQKEAFLVETAHFLVYYLAVQLNDDRRNKPEFRHLAQAWRVLHKDMEKTVVAQLHVIAAAHRDGNLAS